MLTKDYKVLLLAIARSGCLDLAGGSSNRILREVASAKGDRKAILFMKYGGATVANSYQISIGSGDYKLGNDEAGNVFTLDDDHGAAHLDSSSIGLVWAANDTLLISYERIARVFVQEHYVDGVVIRYQER